MHGSQAWRRAARLSALVAAFAVPAGVCAQINISPGFPGSVEDFDPREVALLPSWCIYTDTFRDRIPSGKDKQMIAQWQARMGEVFMHMHHYCYGLMKTNRANLLAKDTGTRMFYLRDAIKEFDYVLDRAPADFVLVPEILARKGENLIRLGKGSVAVLTLERAIELNPSYWPAYAHMSDLYKASGDLKTAREWLHRGLEQAPDTKALQRRIDELSQPASGKKQN